MAYLPREAAGCYCYGGILGKTKLHLQNMVPTQTAILPLGGRAELK